MSGRKTYWTREEIEAIGAEVGIPITRGLTLASMYSLPEGLDRSQIAMGLRFLVAQSEADFVDVAED